MRIGILEPSLFSKKAIGHLQRLGKVERFSGNDLDVFLRAQEVLFVRLGYFIDGTFLDMAKKIRFLCSPTTGLNHIDVASATKRNIEIVSLRGEQDFLSQIRATPEHAFGLVIALLRNYKHAFLSAENPQWDRDRYRGEELFGNSVGIIGFGRVGRILAKYFSCFGSEVLFWDIDSTIKETANAYRAESLEQLLGRAKIVIMAASYTEQNERFFGEHYIDMLDGKYFVNISRGELLDEEYLVEKIESATVKGVALDVISRENNSPNLAKLIELTEKRNLILTPHVGGATYCSMAKTEEFIASKLLKIIGGNSASLEKYCL